MDFQELLNDYIELFSCTAKELADASRLNSCGYQPLPYRKAYS